MSKSGEHQLAIPSGLANNWGQLAKILKEIAAGPGIAVAFSGGLDSRFLIHACILLDLEVLALHFTGQHIQHSQTLHGLLWLEDRKIPCVTVRVDPLEIPEVQATDPERCYHCKFTAFQALKSRAKQFSGFSLEAIGSPGSGDSESASLQLCDGTLFSDKTQYRPGQKATQELGVRSPLAESGLTKSHVRELAAALGMDAPDQPGQTCLLTRLDYGLPVDAATLENLEEAEEAVVAVLSETNPGSRIPEFRVRLINRDGAAHPELHLCPPENGTGTEAPFSPAVMDKLRAALAAHGMPVVEIRVMQELSGFFDRKSNLRTV
ncbi:hypothetical protein LJC48_07880 [Desulfovibrio sp. OttesenSCG-928-C06]|nr:hypothetical protein [Desulfovibrio sp. OttesenSCG-928-C06]